MHDGSLSDFDAVLDHYNDITVDPEQNSNLNPRLTVGAGPGNRNASGQKLLLVDAERRAITAFLKTLSGQAVYTDPRWSDPFTDNGNLVLSQ